MALTDYWKRNGVVWRSPGSGSIGPSEAIPQAVAMGYYLHFFDVKTGEWTAERAIVGAVGGVSIPWTRVTKTSDVDLLRVKAYAWEPLGSRAIAPNLEIGDGGPGSTRDPDLMRHCLYNMSLVGRGVVITDGWADPIGCWSGYLRWSGSVECFPEQYRPYADVAGCVMHANAFFRGVIAMLGAYGTTWKGRKPRLFDYQIPIGTPHYIYTGDDVEDWRYW